MPPSEELKGRLDASDVQVRAYVAALMEENSKAQRRVVKLEAANDAQKNKIAALEEECAELRKQTETQSSVDVLQALRDSPELRNSVQRSLDKAVKP